MGHRLAGKVALVTGAAQGIGKACAELFAKGGAYRKGVQRGFAPLPGIFKGQRPLNGGGEN